MYVWEQEFISVRDQPIILHFLIFVITEFVISETHYRDNYREYNLREPLLDIEVRKV